MPYLVRQSEKVTLVTAQSSAYPRSSQNDTNIQHPRSVPSLLRGIPYLFFGSLLTRGGPLSQSWSMLSRLFLTLSQAPGAYSFLERTNFENAQGFCPFVPRSSENGKGEQNPSSFYLSSLPPFPLSIVCGQEEEGLGLVRARLVKKRSSSQDQVVSFLSKALKVRLVHVGPARLAATATGPPQYPMSPSLLSRPFFVILYLRFQ